MREVPMDPILIAAAGGMRSRMASLDMLANNLSNADTSGFKADRELTDLFDAQVPDAARHWTDYSQGALEPTGNPLDLALNGDGFFALNGPSGVVYSRSGSFRPDRTGVLTSLAGLPVRNALDGSAIHIKEASPVDISGDGTVTQDGGIVGKLSVVKVGSANTSFRKAGSSIFAASGEELAVEPSDAEVRHGVLERSNVSVADSSVRLVGVMRQFEMLQRAAATSSEMDKHATEEVARV